MEGPRVVEAESKRAPAPTIVWNSHNNTSEHEYAYKLISPR